MCLATHSEWWTTLMREKDAGVVGRDRRQQQAGNAHPAARDTRSPSSAFAACCWVSAAEKFNFSGKTIGHWLFDKFAD